MMTGTDLVTGGYIWYSKQPGTWPLCLVYQTYSSPITGQ